MDRDSSHSHSIGGRFAIKLSLNLSRADGAAPLSFSPIVRMKGFHMISFRKLLCSFSTAVLVLALCALPSRSQGPAQSEQSAEEPNALSNSPDASPNPEDAPVPKAERAEISSGISSSGSSPFTLPDAFKKHWLGQLSAGVVRDNGILNGLFPNGSDSHATYSDASVSLAYDLPRKHSDYLLDYSASGRHYNQNPQLDVITHDLGLSQVGELGDRTKWNLNYRFSMTPDFASTLMAESLSQETAFVNPVSTVGISAAPGFLSPLPSGTEMRPVQSPSDGLITLRSIQMTNSTNANLFHALSSRTMLSFGAGYARTRFEDQNLFGNNLYTASATISRSLTPRTSVGISYQAGRMDLSSVFNRTVNQEVALVITELIGHRTVLSLQGGPSRIETRAQETIPLSSLVADLLDRPSLTHTTSRAAVGWLGIASIASNIHNLGVNVRYKRSVAGIGGLGGASLSQAAAVNLAREIGQKTSIFAGVSYTHSQMLGTVNPIRLDQEGFTASVTRRFTRDLDLTSFFVYTKVLRGLHGTTLVNRNSVGVSLVYNFHRLTPPAGI
jgi:hypothetical protein